MTSAAGAHVTDDVMCPPVLQGEAVCHSASPTRSFFHRAPFSRPSSPRSAPARTSGSPRTTFPFQSGPAHPDSPAKSPRRYDQLTPASEPGGEQNPDSDSVCVLQAEFQWDFQVGLQGFEPATVVLTCQHQTVQSQQEREEQRYSKATLPPAGHVPVRIKGPFHQTLKYRSMNVFSVTQEQSTPRTIQLLEPHSKPVL